MKRVFIVLVLLCALSATAFAQEVSEYTILPGSVDMEAMLTLTFAEQISKAHPDSSRNYAFYDIPGSDGPPFCGANDVDFSGQLDISIYTANYKSSYEPYLSENIEPSGVAQCQLTREEALDQAEKIMATLGLEDYRLHYISAHGRVESFGKNYLVFFGQSLHGCPVYWSAQSAEAQWGFLESNSITISLDDPGLINVSGRWSQFEPYGTAREAMAPEQAIEALSATDSVELCYLLMPGQNGSVAIPAYRWQNHFIHAVTGAILQ